MDTPFDPATAAALQAQILAKVDDQQFTLTVSSSLMRASGLHPLQPAFTPKTSDVRKIAWAAVYRRQPFGDFVVCDVADVPVATCAILQHVLKLLNLLDLKKLGGGSSNPVGTV